MALLTDPFKPLCLCCVEAEHPPGVISEILRPCFSLLVLFYRQQHFSKSVAVTGDIAEGSLTLKPLIKCSVCFNLEIVQNKAQLLQRLLFLLCAFALLKNVVESWKVACRTLKLSRAEDE